MTKAESKLGRQNKQSDGEDRATEVGSETYVSVVDLIESQAYVAEKSQSKNVVTKPAQQDSKSYLEPSTGSAPPCTRLGQSTSIGSSPEPPPPPFRRNTRYQTPTRPGAVAISPILTAEESAQLETTRGHLNEEMNVDDSILVNAHLVDDSAEERRDVEQGQNEYDSAPFAASREGVVKPPVVAAKIVEDATEFKPGLYDFLRNRTLRVVGLTICLIIAGLTVGVVIGFGGAHTGNTTSSAFPSSTAFDELPTTSPILIDSPETPLAPVGELDTVSPASDPVPQPTLPPSSSANTFQNDGAPSSDYGEYEHEDD